MMGGSSTTGKGETRSAPLRPTPQVSRSNPPNTSSGSKSSGSKPAPKTESKPAQKGKKK